MKISLLPEPELVFGHGSPHIDIRFGIANYGPHDVDDAKAPEKIRIGIIGTVPSAESLTEWLRRCRNEIASSGSRLDNLFTSFPGFNDTGCFHSHLITDPTQVRTISARQVEDIAQHSQGVAIADAVELIFNEMVELKAKSRPDVILCAIPEPFLHLDAEDDEDLAAEVEKEPQEFETRLDLRSYLKAKSMQLGIPIQLLRPETYGDKPRKKARRNKKTKFTIELDRTLQDEATRAWNLHTALYYKAGGRPWRIPTFKTDLLTCFVGVSFYRSLDENALQTSVAQVYNERGEGIVVRGQTVRTSKDDPAPHLPRDGARSLLDDALKRFEAEHHTKPARVVLHKSSKYSPDELAGFSESAHGLYAADFLTIDKTFIRLFRQGRYPPLRGTYLELDDNQAVLYSRGSIPFFGTYPGMYIPRPLLIRRAFGDTPLKALAGEALSLTKLNWNNTQFDGSWPITLRVAKEVGKILKYVPDGSPIQAHYAFYM
jgi:hypothetical protein